MRKTSAAPRTVENLLPMASTAGGNPHHGIPCGKPAFTLSPLTTKLTRILSPVEIKTIWEVLSAGLGDDIYNRALKLILVSGQGPRAVAAIHSVEISGKCWTVPSFRAWDRQPYRVYLTPTALDLTGHTKGYIFPSGGDHPITSSNLARYLSSKEISYCGLEKWTPRDLRTTVMHYMNTLEIAIDVRKAIFGTAITGSKGDGSRLHEYNTAVSAAMNAWEAELLRIVGHDQTPIQTHPIFGL